MRRTEALVAIVGLAALCAVGCKGNKGGAGTAGAASGSAASASSSGAKGGSGAGSAASAGSASGGSAAPAAAAYDVAPMMQALRARERAGLAKWLGRASLAELPLYDIALTLDPAQARLSGRLRLTYRNPAKVPVDKLPLLLHPNAPRELARAGGGAGGGLGGAGGAGGTAAGSGRLDVVSAKALAGPAVTLQRERATVVWLRFAKPVAPGQTVRVEVSYRGALRRLPASSNDIFSQALASMGIGGGGSGASDYGLMAVGDGIACLASAYPMVAPYDDGKFDVVRPTRFGDLAYNKLANFKLTVSVPAGTRVFTNLHDGSAAAPKAAAGRAQYVASGAANRDLVLVAGADLTTKQRSVDDVTVRAIFKRGDGVAGARALDTAVRSLQLFQERFGPYPYRELDVAEATLVGGAGGVEFPGMVLIAGMFYRPPSRSSNPLARIMSLVGNLGSLFSKLRQPGAGGGAGGLGGFGPRPGGGAGGQPRGGAGGQPRRGQGRGGAGHGGAPGGAGGGGGLLGQLGGGAGGGIAKMDKLVQSMMAFTVAHEIGHQYFAGLVGANCRRHASVDEPLAQFAAGQYMESVHGRKLGRRLLEMNAKMNYGVHRMMGGKDMPAAQPVSSFPNAYAYAGVVYGKAPYLYVTLRDRLGAKRFDAALRKTVDRFRFKHVTLEQWIAELEKNAGGASSGVKAAARRWLYERHGDADLGVDDSGRAVLTSMLGKQGYAQLSRTLSAIGMTPGGLIRMLIGKGGVGAGGGLGGLGGLGGSAGAGTGKGTGRGKGAGGLGGLGGVIGDLLKKLQKKP